MERPDVLVVGGGTGGCAAALAATRNARTVVMLEETDWPGGQLTSQGVSAPDAHPYIETVCTSSFRAFRDHVRNYYRLGFRMSPEGREQKNLNPGMGWVSHLCHEPRAGVAALRQLLQPAIDSGKLGILYRARPIRVAAERGTVTEVKVQIEPMDEGGNSRTLTIRPRYVVEAGELGDFLKMAGIPFRVGTESREETGEADAPTGPSDPARVQSFTYPFAIEFRPGENHVIPRPAGYERYRDEQPFSLQGYKVFQTNSRGQAPFWTYRRLVSAALFNDPRLPNDIAMINWPGNDYHGADIVNLSPEKRKPVLEEAKQLSLSFLYWLQTECPRDEGGKGYPEFRLRHDVMDTTDGLSKFPYIREGRRIRALKTIVESDISQSSNPLARARLQDDSVGVGLYGIDIHKCAGPGNKADTGRWVNATPFQIPLGALIPEIGGNVIAGAKNLGVTHVTNGAYRLHPIEWNTGESAGTLAAFCIEREVKPGDVWKDRKLLREFQQLLVGQGIPLFWFNDLTEHNPLFVGAQMLAVEAGWVPDEGKLEFGPEKQLTDAEREHLQNLGVETSGSLTRGDLAKKYTLR
jgi:hypothetical protein